MSFYHKDGYLDIEIHPYHSKKEQQEDFDESRYEEFSRHNSIASKKKEIKNFSLNNPSSSYATFSSHSIPHFQRKKAVKNWHQIYI